VRVLIEVSAVHPAMLRSVSVPIAAMMAAGLAAALVLHKTGDSARQSEEMKFHNPFELGLAVKFGLLFAIVLVASKAAHQYFGQSGTYGAALLAGLTDMDAITLSLAKLARDGSLEERVAAIGILIGCASNTMVKGTLAVVLGGWLFGRKVVAAFLLMLLAGGVAAAFWL